MTRQEINHMAEAEQFSADVQKSPTWAEQAALPPSAGTTRRSQTGFSSALLLSVRDRLRCHLEEVAAELDDLTQAVAYERREQELGIPSLTLATLQAHLYGAQSALLALHSVLIQVEALCDRASRSDCSAETPSLSERRE